MKLLEDEHYFYSLWLDESSGERYLEVVCGRVAIFTITIRLTADETAKSDTEPAFVRALAQEVSDSPDSFIARRVDLPADTQ